MSREQLMKDMEKRITELEMTVDLMNDSQSMLNKLLKDLVRGGGKMKDKEELLKVVGSMERRITDLEKDQTINLASITLISTLLAQLSGNPQLVKEGEDLIKRCEDKLKV